MSAYRGFESFYTAKGGDIVLQKGLSPRAVEDARRTFGANILEQKKSRGFFARLLESFGDPVIRILLIALGINVFFLFQNSDWYESVIIAAAILLATVVSTLSEMGSEAAFKRLQKDAAKIHCKVLRQGGLIEIPVADVVVGDYVKLQAGDKVPADGYLLEGKLEVDQSSLNGESKEAQKEAVEYQNSALENWLEQAGNVINNDVSNNAINGTKNSFTASVTSAAEINTATINATASRFDSDRQADSQIFLHKNRLFLGTVVCSGEGIMRVTRVGGSTFYGGLARELQGDSGTSPMKERLTQLAKSISKFGYVGAILVAFAYLFNVFIVANNFDPVAIRNFFENDPYMVFTKLLYAITLAVTVIVMAVPEGLPMMITVVLTSNMKKMMKDNVIVRKLVGIETAGSLNILFCDKTGTLTAGKLQVAGFIDGECNVWQNQQNPEQNGGTNASESKKHGIAGKLSGASIYSQKLWEYVYSSLFYNNSASMSKGKAIGGNSTDRTLMEYASRHSLNDESVTYKTVVPFSSDYKYMISQVKNGDSKEMTLIKGAPEVIIDYCTSYVDKDGEKNTLSSAQRKALGKQALALQKRAYRLIACACTARQLGVGVQGFNELTFVGMACVRDDIRQEAKQGVDQIKGAGIQIVMITGDAPETARAIAQEVGLIEAGADSSRQVITSSELAGLTDDEVRRKMPHLRVVARALPSDKSRLVKVAQSAGLVTGMTGDGVNDAPALKKADVSFAMGSGTEVAKEASDIVILDDNLLSIAKAIRYGRTIFKSIRKFIIFQLTLNFCAMGVSMLAPFFGITSPITIIQILWINMVMDTLAGLAFAGEVALHKYMKEPPKPRHEKIINKFMWLEILIGGAFCVVIAMWFLNSPFILSMFEGGRDIRFFTAFFGLFMFMGIFNAFCARTPSKNLAYEIAGNKPFLMIMGIITIVQVLILFFGGQIFRTNGLELDQLLLIVALALLVPVGNFIRKLVYKVGKVKVAL